MSVETELVMLALVIGTGAWLARQLQSGYIDYLTPLLCLYALNALSRGVLLYYAPEWLDVNGIVRDAGDTALAEALWITTLSLLVLIGSYAIVTALTRSRSRPDGTASPVQVPTVVWLMAGGLACRVLLRLAAEEIIFLPDWSATPIETLGWSALGGVFLAGFLAGRSDDPSTRSEARALLVLGTAAILFADARLTESREATLQPLVAGLLGLAMGARIRWRRAALIVGVTVLPLFLWIGAMKTYRNLELGHGPAYLDAAPAVREYTGLPWPQFMLGLIQDRFHGLDSLVVTRAIVPAVRPFEEGSAWTRVAVSAFVPRALLPDKQVGWGLRFAMEFWGMAPEAEGRAAVGISHLGTLYIYGGLVSCLSGMAIFGAGLGLLAAYLRRRCDAFGDAVFVLTALTLCQIDRDLEVVLGGVLKLLALCAALLVMRPFAQVSGPPRAVRELPA